MDLLAIETRLEVPPGRVTNQSVRKHFLLVFFKYDSELLRAGASG